MNFEIEKVLYIPSLFYFKLIISVIILFCYFGAIGLIFMLLATSYRQY